MPSIECHLWGNIESIQCLRISSNSLSQFMCFLIFFISHACTSFLIEGFSVAWSFICDNYHWLVILPSIRFLDIFGFLSSTLVRSRRVDEFLILMGMRQGCLRSQYFRRSSFAPHFSLESAYRRSASAVSPGCPLARLVWTGRPAERENR